MVEFVWFISHIAFDILRIVPSALPFFTALKQSVVFSYDSTIEFGYKTVQPFVMISCISLIVAILLISAMSVFVFDKRTQFTVEIVSVNDSLCSYAEIKPSLKKPTVSDAPFFTPRSAFSYVSYTS